jgi:hypothetical protein
MKIDEHLTAIELDAEALARVHGGYSDELFAKMQQAVAGGLTINSTWTGQHGSSSAGLSHYQGRAFDSIGSQQDMWKYFHQIAPTNPRELIFHDKHFENGRSLPRMGGHDTHVHTGM